MILLILVYESLWDIPHISYNSVGFHALYIALSSQNNPCGPLFHCSVFGRQHPAPQDVVFTAFGWKSPPRLSPATEGAAPSSVWQGPWMRHHEMMDIRIPWREKGRLGKWRIMLKSAPKKWKSFCQHQKSYIYICFVYPESPCPKHQHELVLYLFLFVIFFLRVLLKEQAFNIKTILGDREFVETYAPLEHWFSFQWEQIWSMAENRLRPASWVSAGRDVFLWTIWRCLLQQLWYLFSRILLLHGSFYGS